MRSAVVPTLAVVAFVALIAVSVGGCPPALECESQNGCPVGQVCNADGKCVGAPPPPPGRDAGPGQEGEGEGEGEGDVQTVARTVGPVTMFQPDDENPGKALVGIADDTAGGLDEITRFDLATGRFDSGVAFDFDSLATGQCRIDTVTSVTAADVGGAGNLPNGEDEQWFSCQSRVDFVYSGDFANTFTSNVGSAEIVRFLVPEVDDQTGPNARIVVAKRGATQLKILQLDPTFTSDRNQDFGVEQVNVTFTHIEQVFVLRSGDAQFGDILLVFDRAQIPKLVPIQRDPGTVTWHGAPLFQTDARIAPLALPADTHAVFFNENIPVNIDTLDLSSADLDTVNLVVLRPSADSNKGLVTYVRYEVELTVPGANFGDASHFVDLNLNASDPTVEPPATDRILLDFAGGDLFYSLTQSDHAWRIKIPVDQGDDLNSDADSHARVLFVRQADDHPNGMILFPNDLDHAWFTFDDPNTQEIDLLTFDPTIQ